LRKNFLMELALFGDCFFNFALVAGCKMPQCRSFQGEAMFLCAWNAYPRTICVDRHDHDPNLKV